jgi:hypothetical protein
VYNYSFTLGLTMAFNIFLVVLRPLTLGAYKHETDFEDRRNKVMDKIQTARSQVQVNKRKLLHYSQSPITGHFGYRMADLV